MASSKGEKKKKKRKRKHRKAGTKRLKGKKNKPKTYIANFIGLDEDHDMDHERSI